MDLDKLTEKICRLAWDNEPYNQDTRSAIRAALDEWDRSWHGGWNTNVTWTGTALPASSYTWNPGWSLPASPEPLKLTADERKGYREQFAAGKACVHCGGLHLRACPRIRRIVMRNKEEISEVEFWPDASWPKTEVVFPEDFFSDEDQSPGSSTEPGD